nr:uncharacterized protein LOC125623632 [Caretta caretta]
MRPSSSGSCPPSTPCVSLHSREGRTHWSCTAARWLWWRGLCTMTPALEPDLETHLLRAALHAVFTLGTEKDITQVQDLHRVLPDLLDALLGNLLAESPDTDQLHYILVPLQSCWARPAARPLPTVQPPMGLEGHTDGNQNDKRVCVSFPGLTIHEAEDLWCCDWHQDCRLLGYRNTARVQEVFRKFFSEGQRRLLLWTAVLAIHDPLLRVSQAGLVLAFSLLGEAQQLMGDKQEAITANVNPRAPHHSALAPGAMPLRPPAAPAPGCSPAQTAGTTELKKTAQ